MGRSSSHINTFGGDVSGPIRKNKLFFAYTYEDIRQVIPDPFVTSIPTSLQRQGNFSQTYYAKDASGNPLVQTIYDPFSTITGPNGSLTRTPFPGNMHSGLAPGSGGGEGLFLSSIEQRAGRPAHRAQ